jgi:predicted  nucleic acid-binding Zn-ribbon protein
MSSEQVDWMTSEKGQLQQERMAATEAAEALRVDLMTEKQRVSALESSLSHAVENSRFLSEQMNVLQGGIARGGNSGVADHSKELAVLVRKYETANALYMREKDKHEKLVKQTDREGAALLDQIHQLEREKKQLQEEVRRKEQQLLIRMGA